MLNLVIPWQLRELLRAAWEYPSRRTTITRICQIRRNEGVSMGFGGVLEDGRPIHGGAVKLLPLRKAFGGSEGAFGILYAVSSSPPACASKLFRHCRKSGIKIVWNQNGVAYPAWAGSESERFNAPMRMLRGAADFVVYQSKFCKASADKFLGPCEAPSAIFYNPVDLGIFFPDRAKEFFGHPLRLLAAGTHGTRDRVTSALEAVCELRKSGVDASLTVAGRFQWPGGENDFSGTTTRLGLQGAVRRIARFSQGDAPALYREHDLLVHPKYMDPCPTVVLEAMASGLPVVGSRSGGMPEIVTPDCGVLIDAPEDWDTRHTPSGSQLAAAIARILPNLPEFSLAARRNAEVRFDVSRWIEEHERIFRELRDP